MQIATIAPLVASDRRADDPAAQPLDAAWKLLYRVGAAAALLTAVLIPLQVLAFIRWPPPLDGTALDWFQLFASNRLAGLLAMDLLLMADYVLLIPIVLALYVALRRASQALMALGVATFFVAIAAYFASNTAFEMLALSGHYAAATSDAQRATYLAAGEAMIATYQGTAFQVSYVLGSLAGIAISAAMLRRAAFGKVAGWAGIAGNVIGFGLYLPTVGIVLGVLSGPVLWVWYLLIARGLIRLAKGQGGRDLVAQGNTPQGAPHATDAQEELWSLDDIAAERSHPHPHAITPGRDAGASPSGRR